MSTGLTRDRDLSPFLPSPRCGVRGRAKFANFGPTLDTASGVRDPSCALAPIAGEWVGHED